MNQSKNTRNTDQANGEQNGETAQLVFLDTDIGADIDDALALALTLQSPELHLMGVSTVFGDTQLRAQLVAHILTVFASADIPVAAGVSEPLKSYHPPPEVSQAAILPRDAPTLPLSPLSGPALLIETALAHYGQLNLFCLGPLTNLATALRMEPRLFMALRNVVVMGGSSSVPLPDWNIRSDVEAAQYVLSSGVPLTFVGLDVTLRCQLQQREIKRLNASSTSRAHLLSALLAIWQQNRQRWQSSYPFLHDPLTVAALCNPALFTFKEVPLWIFTKGPLQGFTVPHALGGTWVKMANSVDVEKARAWMMQHWLS